MLPKLGSKGCMHRWQSDVEDRGKICCIPAHSFPARVWSPPVPETDSLVVRQGCSPKAPVLHWAAQASIMSRRLCPTHIVEGSKTLRGLFYFRNNRDAADYRMTSQQPCFRGTLLALLPQDIAMKDETTAHIMTVTSHSCHTAVSCPTRQNINMCQRTKLCPQSSSNLTPPGKSVLKKNSEGDFFLQLFSCMKYIHV